MDERLVTIEEVAQAEKRISDVVLRTPVEDSRSLSVETGVTTLLKFEHLQRTGSFKIRGALNRIRQLSPDERSAGVVCASAGNHAQGVALAAALEGVASTVFMPTSAPLPKVEATRGYGAEIELVGSSYDDAYDAAEVWADDHGAVFVHAYDHPQIIAGQGSLGLELLEQVPDAGTVVVPIGGGGLASGIAVAVKARRPEVRVIGVQAAGLAAFPAALEASKPLVLDAGSTIADGIAVKTPGTLTLAHVEALVDDVVTVTDESIARAVLLLVERAKQAVEPAGAAGLAALLEHRGQLSSLPAPVVVVLCGGNIDPLLLARIIQSGLYEEGRYTLVTARIIDQPGSLVRLLEEIAALQANILSVSHHRLATRLGVLEVEVELELETRGPDHITRVLEGLAQAGYAAR